MLKNLNKEQELAVKHKKGPLLMLAGAGTGKTEAITKRIAYLINNGKVAPSSIFAVTFTNKAANEMRNRIAKLIGTKANEVWISTFHSSCSRILRENPGVSGHTQYFSIYDQSDKLVLIKEIIAELGLDKEEYKKTYVEKAISEAKQNNIGVSEFLKSDPDDYFGKDKHKVIYQIYKIYQKTLEENNALDFDDLLMKTVRLLKENSAVKKHYNERFKHIMVDEYQDTNYLQFEFVKLLAQNAESIAVVGDDDQCIYEWRGANINNILSFENKFKGTKIIKLEQNYRSTTNILEAAYSVVKNNKNRKDKKLWTNKKGGEKVVSVSLDNHFDEAKWTLKEINKLMKKNKYKYKDFAILYRTNVQSRQFEENFLNSGLADKYQIYKGTPYFKRNEIKDMIAYLRVISNPKDNISLERIINTPKRGIGKVGVDKIRIAASKIDKSIYEYLKDEKNRDKFLTAKSKKLVSELVDNITKIIEMKEKNASVLEIYDSIFEASGYKKVLEDDIATETKAKLENILDFRSVIREKELVSKNLTLDNFLEDMALIEDKDADKIDTDVISLMTLHAAKGLEFKVVFIVGFEEELFPDIRPQDDKEQKEEEERRLCYVGMTRAKELLYITHARERVIYGEATTKYPSRFLEEIDTDYYTSVVKEQNAFVEGGAMVNKSDNGYYPDVQPEKKERKKPLTINATSLFDINDEDEEENKLIVGAHFDKNIFKKGSIVNHNRFGIGTVISSNEMVDVVEFKIGGRKTLGKGYIQLVK